MTRLVWLRRDLRIQDNPALYHVGSKNTGAVIALYTIVPEYWQQHNDAPVKIAFWLDALKSMQLALEKLNIPLIVICSSIKDLGHDIEQVLIKHDVEHLYFNKELELNELARDQDVANRCRLQNIRLSSYSQSCILPPGEVLKKDNTPYTIFTPFKNQWLKMLHEDHYQLLPAPKKQEKTTVTSTEWTDIHRQHEVAYNKKCWPASEQAAQKRLQKFVAEKIQHYNVARDVPSLNQTSLLSPYLAAGILSAKQCLQAALQIESGEGRTIWINELIWRDFYKHIMAHYPKVAKHRAFKLTTEKIVWNNNDQHFKAWCEGKTGIPIVDAAMRQLNQTGWMHNRLRMVSAMFFSKNLFLDWRLGERYFMQQLIDGELSANNGGWQWSASTGTDAAPYFRVFNPYRQSERFDPEGKFIRTFCPELAELDNKTIHQPPPMPGYFTPIVDVKQTRQYAIETFKSI